MDRKHPATPAAGLELAASALLSGDGTAQAGQREWNVPAAVSLVSLVSLRPGHHDVSPGATQPSSCKHSFGGITSGSIIQDFSAELSPVALGQMLMGFFFSFGKEKN